MAGSVADALVDRATAGEVICGPRRALPPVGCKIYSAKAPSNEYYVSKPSGQAVCAGCCYRDSGLKPSAALHRIGSSACAAAPHETKRKKQRPVVWLVSVLVLHSIHTLTPYELLPRCKTTRPCRRRHEKHVPRHPPPLNAFRVYPSTSSTL